MILFLGFESFFFLLRYKNKNLIKNIDNNMDNKKYVSIVPYEAIIWYVIYNNNMYIIIILEYDFVFYLFYNIK